LDQSVMLGPFLWGERARSRCVLWAPGIHGGKVIAEHDGYGRLPDPVLHRRTLELDAESRMLTIGDDIVAQGAHQVAVYFQLAEDAAVSTERPNRYRIDTPGGTVILDVEVKLTVEIMRSSKNRIGGWVSVGQPRKTPSTTLIARCLR